MMPLHRVTPSDQFAATSLGIYEDHAKKLSVQLLMDRFLGSVHIGYQLCFLEEGGEIQKCFHAFEKTIYILEGELEFERDGVLFVVSKDDFLLIPVAAAYSFRNNGKVKAKWVEVCAPQPKTYANWQDTFFLEPVRWDTLIRIVDRKDPRVKMLGHYDGLMPDGFPMHGDLQGFSVKRFIEKEFGAVHMTMFTVEFSNGGICNHHDHAFEEAYLILEGSVDVIFDEERYTLNQGDFAWTGVGSRHAFFPVKGKPVRWLEIQAPQPPLQWGSRWHSRWEDFSKKSPTFTLK
jgi:mannose-6-phosphate isomerase-like protein (cupin superfamily)